MRKILPAFILSVSIASSVHAQKPLFDAFEIKSFIYSDDYGITNQNWPHLFKSGSSPLVNTDTIQFGLKPKGGAFPNFNNGWGIHMDVVKGLYRKSGSTDNLVDWSLGVGYRKYTTSDEQPYFDQFSDTSIHYQVISTNRTFTQQYTDLQSRVVIKTSGGSIRSRLYAGFAIQVSIPLAGRLKEDYSQATATWNTFSRTWDNRDQTALHQEAPAQKITYFSWGIPVGLSVQMSHYLSFLFEISYWHNTNRQYDYPPNYGGHQKNYSESGALTIGLRYHKKSSF